MLLLKYNNCLVHMEKWIVFAIDIQIPACLKKSINSPIQHLQNIISFNFLYLQKNDLPKIIDFKTHKQIK